jgi:hypothetical protein
MEMKQASDYFAKIEEPSNGCAPLSLSVRGGEPLTTNVEIVNFHASGERWCGESNLFAAGTTVVETGRTITRAPTAICRCDPFDAQLLARDAPVRCRF